MWWFLLQTFTFITSLFNFCQWVNQSLQKMIRVGGLGFLSPKIIIILFQDLDSLLPFEDIVSHPVEGISDQTEELNTEKVERSRPRKILDYALLAKGRSKSREKTFVLMITCR